MRLGWGDGLAVIQQEIADGLNLYAANKNNPVGVIDQTGPQW